MSNVPLLNWAFTRRGLPAESKLILLFLASLADSGDTCRVCPVARIAEFLELHESTTRRYLNSLVRAGLIERRGDRNWQLMRRENP